MMKEGGKKIDTQISYDNDDDDDDDDDNDNDDDGDVMKSNGKGRNDENMRKGDRKEVRTTTIRYYDLVRE